MATQPDKRTVTEIAGDLLLESNELVGGEVAKQLDRPADARALTKREQQEAFWKRFISSEQEAALLAAGQSQMAVSAVVYQRRWELWNDEGTSLTDKLAWAKEMVKLGPPGADDQPAPKPAEEEGYQSAG